MRLTVKKIIVSGERRYRVARELGLSEVPAQLLLGDYRTIALTENMQRNALTAMEEAISIKSLLDEPGVDRKQIMDKLGKAESTISEILKPAELPESMREEALNSAFWSRNKLLKLAKIKDKKAQKAEFEKMKAAVDKREEKKRQNTEMRRAKERGEEPPKSESTSTSKSTSNPDKKIAVFKSHVTKLHDRVKKEIAKDWHKQDRKQIKKELEALMKSINEFLSGQPDEREPSAKETE